MGVRGSLVEVGIGRSRSGRWRVARSCTSWAGTRGPSERWTGTRGNLSVSVAMSFGCVRFKADEWRARSNSLDGRKGRTDVARRDRRRGSVVEVGSGRVVWEDVIDCRHRDTRIHTFQKSLCARSGLRPVRTRYRSFSGTPDRRGGRGQSDHQHRRRGKGASASQGRPGQGGLQDR